MFYIEIITQNITIKKIKYNGYDMKKKIKKLIKDCGGWQRCCRGGGGVHFDPCFY